MSMIPGSQDVRDLEKGIKQLKTLEQEVRNATDDQVNASRLRVRTKVSDIDSELNKFTLSEHLTIVNLLNTMAAHRQQTLQLAAAEMQRQHGLAEQERQDKARAAMEQRAKMQPVVEAVNA